RSDGHTTEGSLAGVGRRVDRGAPEAVARPDRGGGDRERAGRGFDAGLGRGRALLLARREHRRQDDEHHTTGRERAPKVHLVLPPTSRPSPAGPRCSGHAVGGPTSTERGAYSPSSEWSSGRMAVVFARSPPARPSLVIESGVFSSQGVERTPERWTG